VKPTPPFTPNAFELSLVMVWLAVTIPDVQLNPHQTQDGVQLVFVPEVKGFERLATR
jgi:hypothetical protein